MIGLGDCIEGMAALGDRSVDHVICDPPFGDHVHDKFAAVREADGPIREGLSFSALTDDLVRGVAEQVCRVTKRWIVIFCDERSVERWALAIQFAGGFYARGGVWVKTDAMPQMTGDRPGHGTESIVIAHAPRPKKSGRMKWNGGGRPATWIGPIRGVNAEERQHPTQKPMWLMEALVKDFTDPGDLILDPFAGSGSTLVAAIRNGRRAIGFEKDEKYHAIATKRLGYTKEQRCLAL